MEEVELLPQDVQSKEGLEVNKYLNSLDEIEGKGCGQKAEGMVKAKE